MIRVFVLDEHPMIRCGIAAILADSSDMNWVGDSGLGIEALRLVPELEPDVVLMEPTLPDIDSIQVVADLRRLVAPPRVLLLTALYRADTLRRAMEAGAQGAVLKSVAADALLQGIRLACSGQPVLPPAAAGWAEGEAQLGTGGLDSPLTQRERQLLGLMARGLSNQDISTQMHIAMPTVKFHVTNILSKLRAENRTEAVLIALRKKLVDLN